VEVPVKPSSSGVTLVEVLIALIVLGVGIVALAGSSSMVSRMIGRGKAETHATLVASRRMEMLRSVARSTTPPCTAPSFASGGPTSADGLTEWWAVPPAGAVRRVRVTVGYRTVQGSRSAMLETGIEC
jgi:prepilin-type N-terminal cleavage/methylation domain-containing protein